MAVIIAVQRGVFAGVAVLGGGEFVAHRVRRSRTRRGHRGGLLMTLAMVISAIGSIDAVLSGARVPYAMARDGVFFKIADGIHPKFLTPTRALIFQGVLASVMALSGTFEELTNLFIFAGWIFYGLAVAALFRLRKTEPEMPRPYRCWGYPWVPGIFVAGALALKVSILWTGRAGRRSAYC